VTRLTGLWQRNLLGSIVVLAALGVLVAVDLWPHWSAYRHSVVAQRVAPPRAAVTVDGQTWQVQSVRHLGANPARFGPELPPGAVLTVITVARSGGSPGPACTGVLTDGNRRWSPDVGFSVPLADGATRNCARPGPVQFTFLVPADAVPTALDITRLDGQILVRLLL
jgi:hypothetical protein